MATIFRMVIERRIKVIVKEFYVACLKPLSWVLCRGTEESRVKCRKCSQYSDRGSETGSSRIHTWRVTAQTNRSLINVSDLNKLWMYLLFSKIYEAWFELHTQKIKKCVTRSWLYSIHLHEHNFSVNMSANERIYIYVGVTVVLPDRQTIPVHLHHRSIQTITFSHWNLDGQLWWSFLSATWFTS